MCDSPLCAVLLHQSAISEWDTTGDGCINFQEFCAAMRKAEDVGMSGKHACSHCTVITASGAVMSVPLLLLPLLLMAPLQAVRVMRVTA
jgi:EF hand